MNKKVILISVDGMRPDGLIGCGNPYVQTLLNESAYSLSAKTVIPSVTLPCHMSMFHSTVPQRHGVLYNIYMPPVHPVTGLFEHLKNFDKINCMFFGWEHLRDITRPGSLSRAVFIESYSAPNTDTLLTNAAVDYIKENKPDFAFVYMVETDEKGGHDHGWMTKEYFERVSIAIDNVKKLIENFGDEYAIMVVADHGGHDRAHGSDMPEDMTIPVIIRDKGGLIGEIPYEVSILDVAPTIAKLMGVPIPKSWEGKPLV